MIPRQGTARNVVVRAPQGTMQSTATITTTSQTTNTSPFFPDPSSLTPSPQPSHDTSKNDFAKAVLEYAFLGVVLFIVVCVIFRRIFKLKRNNQPMSDFFRNKRHINDTVSRPRSLPRTTGLPPLSQDSIFRNPFHSSAFFAPLPLAYGNRDRRTRGADIGEGGRRLAAGGEGDYHELGGKEMLPAYDNIGGPPKYAEVALQDRLSGRNRTEETRDPGDEEAQERRQAG